MHMITCVMTTLVSATIEEDESSTTPAMKSECLLPVATTPLFSNDVLLVVEQLLLVASNNPG